MRTFRSIGRLALVLVLLASFLIVASGSVGAVTYGFIVGLDSPCLDGSGPASTSLHVELLEPNGANVDQMDVSTNAGGDWSDCFPSGIVRSGRKIFATDGISERTFTVPPLTATLDRVTDTVRGKAPDARRIRIEISSRSGASSRPCGRDSHPRSSSVSRPAVRYTVRPRRTRTRPAGSR